MPKRVRICRHEAFTLVELLVVIAIIGILIALLLPAVQAAREAARRSQCTNNLKQIGLALHMHHDQKRHFPPGHFWNPQWPNSADYGTEACWIAYILPFIEQKALYDQIDWNYGFGSAASPPNYRNLTVTRQVLPAFVCPSNRMVRGMTFNGLEAYARGSYVANNGIGPMRESNLANLPVVRPVPGTTAMSPYTAGVFYLNSNMNMASITDGTTNTVLASEIRLAAGNDFRGVMHYPEGPLYHHNYTPNSLVPDDIRSSFCVTEPEAPCRGAFAGWNPRALTMTARSYHPGGVNAVLGDGSVRFVSETIVLKTWQALCTPSPVQGEEPLGSF